MIIEDLPCLDGAPEDEFPPTSSALKFPAGLLAWGGTLSPERLLAAYRRGIFPWYSQGEPVLWWSPSPRCVLYPDQVYVSKRTHRKLRQGIFRVTADRAFDRIIDHCAAPQPGRKSTWITPEMAAAYRTLHGMGVAHSIEAWQGDALAGGLYGLQPDTSKIALITLCRQLQKWKYGPIDCQVGNPHLFRMGAVEIRRREFESTLASYVEQSWDNDHWRSRWPDDRYLRA